MSSRPGGFPLPAPHGSGRAQSRHPAPRITDSRTAVLSVLVWLRWFPASGTGHLSLARFRDPASPSLHRVPRVGSPVSSVQRDAPTPPGPSRLSPVALDRRYHPCGGRSGGLPGFLGSPLRTCPGLRPRWTEVPDHATPRGSLPPSLTASAPRRLFRGSIRGPHAPCVRIT
jgi:hypothetical protein